MLTNYKLFIAIAFIFGVALPAVALEAAPARSSDISTMAPGLLGGKTAVTVPVTARPEVRSGDMVKVRALGRERSGFNLAEAQGSGMAGDVIVVTEIHASKRYSARITGPGTAVRLGDKYNVSALKGASGQVLGGEKPAAPEKNLSTFVQQWNF